MSDEMDTESFLSNFQCPFQKQKAFSKNIKLDPGKI